MAEQKEADLKRQLSGEDTDADFTQNAAEKFRGYGRGIEPRLTRARAQAETVR